jgi:hypothetical protein
MKKLNKWISNVIYVLVIALFVACSGGNKEVELKLNLEKGEKYYYKFVNQQDITQEMMGDTVEFKQSITWGYELEVLDVVDGIMTIKTTYEHIQMSNDNQVFNLSYDSKEPLDSTNMFAFVMSNFINKSFTMDVTPDGVVSNVQGFDEIFNSIIKELGEDGEMIIQNLRSQFSEESVSENLELGFKIFPENKVKAGDTWYILNIVNGPFSMDIDNTYTLKSVKNGVAKIEMSSTIKQDDEISGIAMLPGAEISIDGTQKGEISVDISTGLVIQSTISQSIKQLIKAQGMEIPVNLESKLEISAKKL